MGILFLLCGALLPAQATAQQLQLNVQGPDGEALSGYRWLLEEDLTYHVLPGVKDPETLSVNLHRSYMPPAAKGHAVGQTAISVDPGKYYFLSVMPDAGYAMGGGPVLPGQSRLSITVEKHPLETAQITIFAFEDNQPINNEPDLPQERGLEGFSVLLEDAIAGGQLLYDAFGNPLGTTYLPDGSVDFLGDGTITTDATGQAVIQNLYPGKYAVQVRPPAGEDWIQTSTLEGKKVIDAWVKSGEPPFFLEFGPPGWHVFVGFVQPMVDTTVLSGGSTITGQVVNLHLSRPPYMTFGKSEPVKHTVPYVGLNDLVLRGGRGIYAQKASPDGSFSIADVPAGTYQLVIWDQFLDFIFTIANVTVPPGGGIVDLGDVGVFQWFARLESEVFHDTNRNGFREASEPGMHSVPVNLRYRDGSIYQALATDITGFVAFDQVFPFFHWLVAEVDFATLRGTGATITVDTGGPVDPSDPFSFGGVLTPQDQPDSGGRPYRTEISEGPFDVLLEGFQGFLGQTSVIQWGKAPYGPGEHGGVTGMVFYAVTRAEDDPRFAAAEEWEPGIPNVVINLYMDMNDDKRIDDLDGDGASTLADVDNHPFGNFPGLEDIDRDRDGRFDYGDAVQISATDSWDDNPPSDCPGDPLDPFYFGGKAYDGMRNWNQVRPAVFDGGYGIYSYHPGGMASGSAEVTGLPGGVYIVEAVAPRSSLNGRETYEIMKEEDRNVDFGDEFDPAPLVEDPPLAVGDMHIVPAELTLFPGVPAPYAGQMRPLADRRQLAVTSGMNAAVDFFMFTPVPVAAHVVGFVLNDLANEFDPNSPQFGEKYAPPWLPVTFRDPAGRVITRVYTDEFGKYNAMIPSSYSANLPSPSGYAPNVLTVTVNDASPIPDPAHPGQVMPDPFYDPQYSQFRYQFQFMPGVTTYLDTPVLPIAAFAGADQFPVDCELVDGTPTIRAVRGPEGGPYVPATGATLTIASQGRLPVPNPAYDGPDGVEPKTILRDYGFGGTPGAVTIGGVPLEAVTWSAGSIRGRVAAGTETGQLEIIRADNGLRTVTGLTVTVGPIAGTVRHVSPATVSGATPIQDAIDVADPGDLILVAPGMYEELVILWKPVLLQGWGAGGTSINALQSPSTKLVAARALVQALIESGAVDKLPGQALGFGGMEPDALVFEVGAGVLVLAKDTTPGLGGFGLVDGKPNARIDGLTIRGSSIGGGITVNGYAHHLVISNNRVSGNAGALGGGIRSGHPHMLDPTIGPGESDYQLCHNDNLHIHHNHVTGNGGFGGAGGGISLHTGSDAYVVSGNYVCGNFSTGDGGGIGHLGLSDGGLIADNAILFNQNFAQGLSISGGGLFIGGEAPTGGPGSLGPGSGSVKVISNLILGNNAAAGDGGGIFTSRVNGQDVAAALPASNGRSSAVVERQQAGASTAAATGLHTVDILNNLIVNNVAALAGGGISMQDTASINIVHNTIQNNDSTATAGQAFRPGNPSESLPQPAGVVGRVHSRDLSTALAALPGTPLNTSFSDPVLVNNVIWHNRSFHFIVDDTVFPPFYGLLPDIAAGDPPVYDDLAVLGSPLAMQLQPRYCILTDTTGYGATNLAADPDVLAEYFNGQRDPTVTIPEPTSTMTTGVAFDEGGNFIDVRYGPLTLTDPATAVFFGDYHRAATSAAIDAGAAGVLAAFPDLAVDVDGDPRPAGAGVDIGADEVPTAPATGR